MASGSKSMVFWTEAIILLGFLPISNRAVSTAGNTPWGGASPLNKIRSSGSHTHKCSGTSPSAGKISRSTPSMLIAILSDTLIVGGWVSASKRSSLGLGPMPFPTVPSSPSGIGIPICMNARRKVALCVTLCPIAIVSSQSAGPYTGIVPGCSEGKIDSMPP